MMGLLRSIIRHSVGIASELLLFRDPYDEFVPTEIVGIHEDECNRPVIQVKANSYREVGKVTEGTTYPGNVSEVHTHVGPHQWEITIEDWEVSDVR